MDSEFEVVSTDQPDTTNWKVFAHSLEFILKIIRKNDFLLSSKLKENIRTLLKEQMELMELW